MRGETIKYATYKKKFEKTEEKINSGDRNLRTRKQCQKCKRVTGQKKKISNVCENLSCKVS